MLRFLIIIGLILLSVPLFNKAADYTKNKVSQVKEAGEDLTDKAKNIGSAVKESVQELPKKIEEKNHEK